MPSSARDVIVTALSSAMFLCIQGGNGGSRWVEQGAAGGQGGQTGGYPGKEVGAAAHLPSGCGLRKALKGLGGVVG